MNYERGELAKLDTGVIVKLKLHDDAGNQTHWLTLRPETFAAVRDALIQQGEICFPVSLEYTYEDGLTDQDIRNFDDYERDE